MGTSVTGDCKCGYSTGQIMIGGGMLSFETMSCFPAFCSHCQDLTVVNLLDEGLKCDRCGSDQVKPYSDKDLQGRAGSETVVSWFESAEKWDATLNNGTYLCPKCREFELRFQDGGIRWD